MSNSAPQLSLEAWATSNLTRSFKPIALPLPAREGFYKYEDNTLIWPCRLDCADSVILKMYYQRGPIRSLFAKIGQFRVEREYSALVHVRKIGIPCTEPLLWGYGRSAMHGRFELLATREIFGGVSLKKALRRGRIDPSWVNLEAIYDSIRRMHQSGLYHGTLELKNIIAVPNPEERFIPYFHDLAKAIIFPYNIVGTRMAWFDLLNLTQSAVRHFDFEACRKPLKHYGLEDRLMERFLSHLSRYNATKYLRNRVRAEFAFRKLLLRVSVRYSKTALAAGALTFHELFNVSPYDFLASSLFLVFG